VPNAFNGSPHDYVVIEGIVSPGSLGPFGLREGVVVSNPQSLTFRGLRIINRPIAVEAEPVFIEEALEVVELGKEHLGWRPRFGVLTVIRKLSTSHSTGLFAVANRGLA
jgi:hypothetical protein